MTSKLTPKQKQFVAEYLVDLNATQAAIRAGYSVKTANEQGARLLAHVSVSAATKAAMDKRAAKAERTAAEVLKDIQAVTLEAREAGDLRSAFRGLELEGKHLGMFTDKIQHLGSVETVVVIKEGAVDD